MGTSSRALLLILLEISVALLLWVVVPGPGPAFCSAGETGLPAVTGTTRAGAGDRGPGNASRTVRVGVYQNKPKIFMTKAGKPAGIFIDILKGIARQENWNLEYRPCDWSQCLAALKAGKIDLMPDVAFSPERQQNFDFHQEPVLESWSQIYANKTAAVDTLADLNGKRLALLKGSIQQGVLHRMIHGFGYHVTLVKVDSYKGAFTLAASGSVDAAVANNFFGNYYYRQFGLRQTGIVFNPVSLFFATAKGTNHDLLTAIDRHLRSMKAEAGSDYYRDLGHWMKRPPEVMVPRYLFWVVGGIGGVLALSLVVIMLLRSQVAMRTRHLAQANETLGRSEKRFRNLFETMAQGVVYRDAAGAITAVNPAAEDILGLSFEEMRGSKPTDPRWRLLREDGSPLLPAEYPPMVALRTGKPVNGVVVGAHHPKTDEIRWTLVDSIPDIPKGTTGPVQVFSMFADITERRKLETQLQHAQKMESIGRLAGGVVHDFNNLLSVILGYSEIVEEELPEDHPQRELVSQILQAGLRAKGLTRQLQAFSRKQVMEMQPVDVNRVVTGFQQLLRRVIGEDVSLELRLTEKPCQVIADTGQLEQVLMNLAVNARDAMPEGGSLLIATDRDKLDQASSAANPGIAPGEYVAIDISDTGHGMDQETRQHIFEPFFTTKGKERGTGLGLATSYGIVQQHGGSIEVNSEKGKGTTFRIYLPVDNLQPLTAEEEDSIPVDTRGSETILLVEDDEPVRLLVVACLEQQGYSVLTADSGEAALALLVSLADSPPHLLLTDVVMPGISGRQLSERVAARFPGIKVLYMSGYTDDHLVHRGVLKEWGHYLQKPFSMKRLALKVREVLDETG